MMGESAAMASMLPLTSRVVISVWFLSVTMLMGCLPSAVHFLLRSETSGSSWMVPVCTPMDLPHRSSRETFLGLPF